MGLLDVRTRTLTQFSDNWTGTSLTTGVQWPNVPFTEPETTAWVRLEIHPQQGLIATLGNNGYNEKQGVFFCSIFTPVGDSTISAYTMGEEFETIFNRQTLGTIIFGVTDFREITEAESSKWHHLQCAIDFEYYEQ